MPEQERIQKRKQRQRRPQSQVNELQPAVNEALHEDIEKKLSELDSALDDYLTATSQPAPDSVVVGHQQPHQVVQPLADEVLVQGFRQTSGE